MVNRSFKWSNKYYFFTKSIVIYKKSLNDQKLIICEL